MSKRNSIILALLFFIVIVEIVVLAPKDLGISPAEDGANGAASSKVGGNASSQIMRDVHLVEAKHDGKEWELWAAKALRPKDNDDWDIEQVRVKFFASNGVIYNVTGKRGHVVPNKNDMRIEGNVITRSSNGYVFKTESAFYDSKNRLLTSPRDVEMTGPPDKEGGRLYLTGAEMTAEFATNLINVNRNVHARKNLKGDKVVTIESQRALFSGKTNSAQFFGNVVIDAETMRITGPEARFVYGQKAQSLDSVEVVGGIRVTDTDKFATSSSVNISFKDDRVVFNGSPRVVQNGDELVGDQIVFLDGGHKVQVSNAKAEMDPRNMEKKKP